MIEKINKMVITKIVEKNKSKIEEIVGRKYKEILDENKQLKEENERLKELVKDMQDDIQKAKSSGYGLSSRYSSTRFFRSDMI